MPQTPQAPRGKVLILLRTSGTFLLLLAILPINLFAVGIALLWNIIVPPKRLNTTSDKPRTILLTGGKMTKALQLARSFHAAGHRVILVEIHKYWLSGHRFSRAVDRFYTVPAPEKDPEGYCQALLDLVLREKVNVFIPVSSPVASYYDALAKPRLAPHCEVLHFDADITRMLDNKFTFCEQARAFGLSAPRSFLITDPQQILEHDFAAENRQYLLKSIPYDSVHRLDTTRLPCPNLAAHVSQLPISPDKPWTMQEFIRGQEYCTHSTVRDGNVRLHGCSESSAFQINYRHVDHPVIYDWVKRFVQPLKLTGQISLDFIQAEDGQVYPIECNPRTHTAITMFHDHPGLAAAYLDAPDDPTRPPLEPLSNSPPTYWLYHELWRLTQVRSRQQLQTRLQILRQGTDAMFRIDDPLPFLMVHHWQIPLLLLMSLGQLKDWIRIDFNIGKLVELGGD